MPENLPNSIPTLNPDASIEQFQEVLKSKKPTCSGIISGFSCGNHQNTPHYDGPIISVQAGDEVAMNSMLMTIVSIDGAGNGEGLIQVPMFGNLKMGVKLSGIQVAEGGCVVAGRAEVSEVSASLLNDKLRAELAKAYAAFVETTDMAIKNAGAIAETINGIKDFLGKAKAFARNYKGGDADAKKAAAYAEYGDKVKDALLSSPDVPEDIKAELQNAVASAAPAWEFYKSGQSCSVGGKGPFFGGFEDCDAYAGVIDTEMAALEKAEAAVSQPVIAPVIAYALKKMAEVGIGALLDGVVQYGVYKYSTGLGWEAAWDKIDFNLTSMFFSGISSAVSNKGLSVAIDAAGSVMDYVINTPAEQIEMTTLMSRLATGAGMGLVANYGGRAVRAVGDKLGKDKVLEGFLRLCKDLNISKTSSKEVAKHLDGFVDTKKFDDTWEKVFGAGKGKVWDDIVGTQPLYDVNSLIYKSFEINANNTKIWVHGNATEHLRELELNILKDIAKSPDAKRLSIELILTDFQSALKEATKNGVKFNELLSFGRWEFKFSPPRESGQLPALIHAQPK